MSMTKTEAQALANGVMRVRPDWHFPGLMHAIGQAKDMGTPAAIAAALYRLADDLTIRTPAVLPEPGPHWGQTTTASRQQSPPCPEHPSVPVAKCVLPDGPCGLEIATADQESGLAKMRAAVAEVAKKHPQRTEGRSKHMSAALRAELDAIQTRRAHDNDDTQPDNDNPEGDQP